MLVVLEVVLEIVLEVVLEIVLEVVLEVVLSHRGGLCHGVVNLEDVLEKAISKIRLVVKRMTKSLQKSTKL